MLINKNNFQQICHKQIHKVHETMNKFNEKIYDKIVKVLFIRMKTLA